MLDKQEIFNKVASHLLTQGEKSIDAECCKYRGPNGLKCAIGVLITDEAYDRGIEARPVVSPSVLKSLRLSGYNVIDTDVSFLFDLQRLHDQYDPALWKGLLKEFAEERELNADVLEAF